MNLDMMDLDYELISKAIYELQVLLRTPKKHLMNCHGQIERSPQNPHTIQFPQNPHTILNLNNPVK